MSIAQGPAPIRMGLDPSQDPLSWRILRAHLADTLGAALDAFINWSDWPDLPRNTSFATMPVRYLKALRAAERRCARAVIRPTITKVEWQTVLWAQSHGLGEDWIENVLLPDVICFASVAVYEDRRRGGHDVGSQEESLAQFVPPVWRWTQASLEDMETIGDLRQRSLDFRRKMCGRRGDR